MQNHIDSNSISAEALPEENHALGEDPGFMISRTYQLIRTALREAIKSHGINVTPEELSVLTKLDKLGESIRMGDLAACMQRDATTITRLLDGLVKKELVQRSPDPKDRRAVLVTLSETGQSLFEKFSPCLSNIHAKTLAGIPSEHLALTAQTLNAIQANLGAELA